MKCSVGFKEQVRNTFNKLVKVEHLNRNHHKKERDVLKMTVDYEGEVKRPLKVATR